MAAKCTAPLYWTSTLFWPKIHPAASARTLILLAKIKRDDWAMVSHCFLWRHYHCGTSGRKRKVYEAVYYQSVSMTVQNKITSPTSFSHHILLAQPGKKPAGQNRTLTPIPTSLLVTFKQAGQNKLGSKTFFGTIVTLFG